MINLENLIFVTLTSIIFLVLFNLIDRLFNKIFKTKNKCINMRISGNIDNFKKNMENISFLVNYVCTSQYNKVLKPLHNGMNMRESLINDKIFNEILITSVNKVLELISDEYKQEIYLFINEERFEYLITEMTMNTLTEITMELNRGSIKKIVNNI